MIYIIYKTVNIVLHNSYYVTYIIFLYNLLYLSVIYSELHDFESYNLMVDLLTFPIQKSI